MYCTGAAGTMTIQSYTCTVCPQGWPVPRVPILMPHPCVIQHHHHSNRSVWLFYVNSNITCFWHSYISCDTLLHTESWITPVMTPVIYYQLNLGPFGPQSNALTAWPQQYHSTCILVPTQLKAGILFFRLMYLQSWNLFMIRYSTALVQVVWMAQKKKESRVSADTTVGSGNVHTDMGQCIHLSQCVYKEDCAVQSSGLNNKLSCTHIMISAH